MPETVVIESNLRWEEFTRRVRAIVGSEESLEATPPPFLFRGQAHGHRGLEASFDRLASDLGEADRIAAYDEYVSQFGAAIAAREYVDVAAYLAIEKDAKAAYQMIAQHYGAPTRLLDWSSSPYVAAYFAVSSADSSSHESGPVIWVLDTKALRTFVGPDSCGLKKVLVPGVRRPLEQFGWFTQNLSTFRDLVLLVEQAAGDAKGNSKAGPVFRKLVIDPSSLSEAVADLSMMGISAERLFPDLDGIAREFRRRVVARLGNRIP